MRALPLLEKLAASPKPKTSWLMALVRTHLELKHYRDAQAILNRLLRKVPGDASLWRLSARLHLNLKNYANAAADLEVAYRIACPHVPGWRTLAGLYRIASVPRKAVKYYRLAFGDNPKAEELDLLAGVFLEGKYHDRALQPALQSIALKPTAKRWRFVAHLYLIEKKYKKALKAFRRAASLSPKDGKPHLMAAYCALQMEKYKETINELQEAIHKTKRGSKTAREAERLLESIKAYLRPVENS